MRNSIRIVSALALAVAFSSWSTPASADVTVFADIFKDKEIFFVVDVVKDKDVLILVTYIDDVDGAAEAEAIVNQKNDFNDNDAVEELPPIGSPPDPDGTWDMMLELDALIDNSINRNTGIIGVNQDVGAMVNQANVVSLAVTASDSSFTDSEALAEQANTDNFAFQIEKLFIQDDPVDAPPTPDPWVPGTNTVDELDPDHTAIILNSVNGNAGIVGVNQNAGSNNNQANVVASAIGIGAHVALSEAALGQTNSRNVIEGIQTVKIDLIENSANRNTGIVGINQTTGNNNNQASVVAFSALVSTAAITVPGISVPPPPAGP
jgi:hypothetical protein